MIVQFTYLGEGIANIKKGDILKYDTERKPLPGDLVVITIENSDYVRRYQSTFRKKKEKAMIKGVLTFV